MTLSQSALAEIRYGYGFRPDRKPAPGPVALLGALRKADPFIANNPIASLDERLAYRMLQAESNTARRQKAGNAEALAKRARQTRERIILTDFRTHFSRPTLAWAPFRERLLSFWADHFTVALRVNRDSILVMDYLQNALRPHLTGNFGDMLEAVVTHPAMLIFLGQANSVGPNSNAGQRQNRGLNENLAREVLELHTMGVSAGYSQDDVRQFAELLTGLTYGPKGFAFRKGFVEPGEETVLGKSYGGDDFDAIKTALRDISLREDTAQHLAEKLIVHFIGGTPQPGHVAQISGAYLSSGGDLMAVYAALLDHEEAWVPELRKAKQPYDFIISSLRAVGLKPKHFQEFNLRDYRRFFIGPMIEMGQPLMQPNGPDGWSEDPGAWITPAGLTARILWGNALAQRHAKNSDPRKFLQAALRDAASEPLRLAVSRAETKHEGIAITLASPDFNRR